MPSGVQHKPAPLPPGYSRRRPETGLLYEVLREHLEGFLAEAEARDGQGVPRYVEHELRRFLDCGVLPNGFARFHCSTCNDDILVAFSCKGRSVCPSCGGRHMVDHSSWWVDELLPDVPMRQWVLTLPYPLRYRLAWDSDLLTRVLAVFNREVSKTLRKLARKKGIKGGQTGAVTVVQRFGSTLNLNVHFHTLAFDGVWVSQQKGDARFVPVCVHDEDVAQTVTSMHAGVERMLIRRGLLNEEGEPCEEQDTMQEQLPLFSAICGASVQQRVAMGPRAGHKVRRLIDDLLGVAQGAWKEGAKAKSPMCARSGPFDLHARTRVGRDERAKRERLCRYLLRPPFSTQRLAMFGEDIESS